jgi:hypothetical protein
MPGQIYAVKSVQWTYPDIFGSAYRDVSNVTNGKNKISYRSGPKYDGYHNLIWKGCTHSKQGVTSGTLGVVDLAWNSNFGPVTAYGRLGTDLSGYAPAMPPIAEWPAQDLWDQIHAKIDLNTSESVLAYSGVIQAVPLLGGLLKANKIINDIGRWATKSLRKKPFSEVLKAAIQADFIDRFVISPTLDDLRKVQQSTNYVLNILREVHERNMAPTALRAEVPLVIKRKTGSVSLNRITTYPPNFADGGVHLRYDYEAQSGRNAALFLLADVRYPADTLDPVKIWAQRVGLTRPLDSVWDLVPFSFVADYFARTGDFISHLSDEMSSVEGLKGEVARIRDCWATTKRYTRVKARGTSCSFYKSRFWSTRHESFTPGTMTFEKSEFERSPLPLQMLDQSGFWDKGGLISPNLSITRARTIAQLFIQAKL